MTHKVHTHDDTQVIFFLRPNNNNNNNNNKITSIIYGMTRADKFVVPNDKDREEDEEEERERETEKRGERERRENIWKRWPPQWLEQR